MPKITSIRGARGYGRRLKINPTSGKPSILGGELFSDDTYFYRAFKDVGTFTLSIADSSINAEMLSIGGGGAGSTSGTGGGGGAGSIDFTSIVLSPGNYDVTVGGQMQSTSLYNSTTQTNIFTSGYGGMGGLGQPGEASTGGANGGQSRADYTWGNVAGHKGNIGGLSAGGTASQRAGGGGGGMGSVGSNATTQNGGKGGDGTSEYSGICSVVGIGELVDGLYYVGAGGPGRGTAGNGGYGKGTGPNTGAGDGAGSLSTGGGKSGVLVIRYLKTAV